MKDLFALIMFIFYPEPPEIWQLVILWFTRKFIPQQKWWMQILCNFCHNCIFPHFSFYMRYNLCHYCSKKSEFKTFFLMNKKSFDKQTVFLFFDIYIHVSHTEFMKIKICPFFIMRLNLISPRKYIEYNMKELLNSFIGNKLQRKIWNILLISLEK